MKRTFFVALMASVALIFASCTENNGGSQKKAETEFQNLKDNQVYVQGKVSNVKSVFHGNDHAVYIDINNDEFFGGMDLGNEWLGKTIDITKPSVKANAEDGGASMFMMQVMVGKNQEERQQLFNIHTDWETGDLTGFLGEYPEEEVEEEMPFKSGKMYSEVKDGKCKFHLYGVLNDGNVFAVKLAGEMQSWD